MLHKSVMKDHIVSAMTAHIAALSESLEAFRSGADLDEDNTIDSEDISRQQEASDMAQRIQLQLDQAQADLKRLHLLSTDACEVADLGALVITDTHIFYISTAAKSLLMDGQTVQPISDKSPIFMAMYGKKSGQSFTVGDHTYTINAIY